MAISKSAVKKLTELYMGETVIIHLKNMSVAIMDENIGEVRVNAMIEETVFDIDQDYLHLGNIDLGVTKTLPHDCVGLIEISMGLVNQMHEMATSDEDIH